MNEDLKNLSDKIQDIRAKDHEKDQKQAEKDRDRNEKDNGFGAGIELIANMIAGGLVGFGIDYFAGTLPLFLILFFLIGFGWGMYRVDRITENLDKS